MKFRDADKWEYFRQPHVIVLTVLAAAVLAGAIYTAAVRLQDRARRSQLPADQACVELVKDEDLCRFAVANESSMELSYKSVTTVFEASGATSVTTNEFESADRMRTISFVNGQETGAFLLLGADAYARDYQDNTWAHYRDENFVPTDSADLSAGYDFSSETSADVVEFRDNYKKIGKESCGDQECLKYEITSPDATAQKTYIWFDVSEYRLRRLQSQLEDTTSNTEYDYTPVTVAAPSPVKEVDEATFSALLE